MPLVSVSPIPERELKSNTWYYGFRCACSRMQALCEDLFAGKTSDAQMHCSPPIAVACECGTVTHADRLNKFLVP